ncbi:MAG TPA: hypothetical protein VFW98_00725 [Gemmatimonadaceae bacterium]|nr:hypothetical protein [Gemmatimonadaceae bacterium]
MPAQNASPHNTVLTLNRGPFHFSARAQRALRDLWAASMAAKQERVACIGGTVVHGVTYITRVRRLVAAHADSMTISARESLQTCGPPTWLGTVHTHIATVNGQPYVLFSGSDMIVMEMWRRQWKTDGVFCILYSESEANCEARADSAERVMYSATGGPAGGRP